MRSEASAATSMLATGQKDLAVFSEREGPYLLAIIDTEEEFDWLTFSQHATCVKTIRSQERAQRLFERHGLRPTYAIDYPVAAQEEGYGPLLDFLGNGSCEIGAQLHPWVNPPLEEEIGSRFSYPGNLPRHLEFEKLNRLTRTIEDNLKIKPTLYRAGRYGAGPNTADILSELGYKIDCSILPGTDLRRQHGPDYSNNTAKPFWFGRDHSMLEIPVTVGLLGAFSAVGSHLYRHISSPIAESCKVPAIFARLRLLDRIRLSPEGTSLAEAKRMTRTLLDHHGQRVFVLSYHSPSLEPGHTPYVRNQRDLDGFLAWIEEYLDFFFSETGGKALTPDELRNRALLNRGNADVMPPRTHLNP